MSKNRSFVAVVLVTGTLSIIFAWYQAPRLCWWLFVQPPDYYAEKLVDKEFRWYGPTQNSIRIPSLGAARALAYLGDPAVPFLLDAIENPDVDINSIEDALSAIGLPASHFRDELKRRDSSGIRRWWQDNGTSTKELRAEIWRDYFSK